MVLYTGKIKVFRDSNRRRKTKKKKGKEIIQKVKKVVLQQKGPALGRDTRAQGLHVATKFYFLV